MIRKLNNKNQKGATLIVVLIILMVLLMAAMGLYSSSNTTAKLTGTIASKEAAILSADVAIVEAKNYLNTLSNKEVGSGVIYYPTEQAVNSMGVPTVINWANVTKKKVNGVELQYVIDRMCSATPVTSKSDQCYISLATLGVGGSQRAGQTQVLQGEIGVYFRITVRIIGAKGSENIVQALVVA